MVTIYALLDPETREARYVGKTMNPVQRLTEHCRPGEKTYKGRWIDSLRKRNMRPEFLALEELETPDSNEAWIEAERFWISSLRFMGARLTNLTEGGEGIPGAKRSEELKERMRILGSGRKHSEVTRAKIAAAKLGRKNLMSEEVRRRLALSRTGRSPSASTRLKLSLANMGHSVSESTRRKISEANRGKKRTLEVRAALARAQTGRKYTPEARARMCLAQQALAQLRKISLQPSGKDT